METTTPTSVVDDTDVDRIISPSDWELPDDAGAIEPELSMGVPTHTIANEHDAPAVDEHRGPLGMIIGGATLASAIVGLGVYSAFGVAGLALTAGAALVAAPAVVIGIADVRRRIRNGRWNSTGRRNRAARNSTTTGQGRTAGGLGTRHGLTRGGHPGQSPRGGPARAAGSRLGTRGHTTGGSTGGAGRGVTRGSGGPSTANGHARSGGMPTNGHGRSRLGRLGRQLFGGGSGAGGGHGHSARSRYGGSHGGAFSGAPGSSRYRGSHRGIFGGSGASGGYSPRRRGPVARAAHSLSNATGVGPVWRRVADYRQREHAHALKRQRARQEAEWKRADARRDRRHQRAREVRRAMRRGAHHAARRAARHSTRAVRSSFARSANWFRRVDWESVIYSAIMGSAAFLAATGRIASRVLRAPSVPVPENVSRAQSTTEQRAFAALNAPIPDTLDFGDTQPTTDTTSDAYDQSNVADAASADTTPEAEIITPPKAPPINVPTSVGGDKMSAANSGAVLDPAHQAVVEVFAMSIGGWQAPDRDAIGDYEMFFNSWAEMFHQLGGIVHTLAERFISDTPVTTAGEYMHEVARGFSAMADAGTDLYGAWRDGNAADIDRVENPRPNEQQMNVA